MGGCRIKRSGNLVIVGSLFSVDIFEKVLLEVFV